MKLHPEALDYKLELGQALTKLGRHDDAIRWYRQAAKSTEKFGDDGSERGLLLARYGMAQIARFASSKNAGGILTDALEMPNQELIETVKFFLDMEPVGEPDDQAFWRSGIRSGSSLEPRILLAELYLSEGEFQLADQAIREFKQRYPRYSSRDLYELWIDALEKGGHDEQQLAELIAEYEAKFKGRPKKYRR